MAKFDNEDRTLFVVLSYGNTVAQLKRKVIGCIHPSGACKEAVVRSIKDSELFVQPRVLRLAYKPNSPMEDSYEIIDEYGPRAKTRNIVTFFRPMALIGFEK